MSYTASDPRYTLTPEEETWCTSLHTLLKANSLPVPSSAFLLAQFALVGKGNTEKAATRLGNYHKTIIGEYEYKTESAASNGSFNFSNRKFPGMFLPCKQDAGDPVMVVMDPTNYKPAELDFNGGGGGEWKLMVGDFLLCLDASNCDLEEVRKGSVWLTDCKGLGWSNFSAEVEKKGEQTDLGPTL